MIGPAGGARGDACGSVAEARRALAARKSALGGFPFDPLKALEENPARGPLEYLGPRHERPLFRRRHADGVATELIALDPKHAFPVYWARFEEGAKVRSWRLLELRLNPGGAYSAGLCEGKLGLSVRDLSIQVVPGAAK